MLILLFFGEFEGWFCYLCECKWFIRKEFVIFLCNLCFENFLYFLLFLFKK